MYNSTLWMTIFDLLIVMAAILGCARLYPLYPKLGRERIGLTLILLGLSLTGLFYALDLVVMWVLPLVMNMETAMNLMDFLHLELQWFFSLATVLLIAFGILNLATSLLAAKETLREQADLAKVQEAENRVLLTQLHQNQKVESLGTLAGGIAHDFNNILSSIINSAELLQIYLGDDPKASKNTDRIIKNGKKASDLIRQILTFSRMDSQELKPSNLAKLVAEDLEIVRATIPSYINIETDLDFNLGTVRVDRTQVSQIILNLVTNAYHAIGDQTGEISVSVSRCGQAECKANTQMHSEDYSVALTIADSGCGMEEAVRERMFDPFFTTKEVGKGTGLGLSSVHGIVKGHNGAIFVESTPNEGTSIRICFPVSTDLEEVEKNQVSAQGISSKSILLIEDNQELGSLIKEHLERQGNHVTHQSDGVAALENFRRNPGNYDLVISDQAVPSLSGRQVAQEILTLTPEIPILLMTGYSEAISEADAKSLGIKEFILKPFSLSELDAIIARCVDTESVNPGIAEQSKETQAIN